MSNQPQDIVREMANSLRNSRSQLAMTLAQLEQVQRQKKIAELTEKELTSYDNEKVWRSCGKMFIQQEKQSYTGDLKHDEKLLEEQVKALEQKRHYLQTTVDNTVESLRRVMGS
ncbi:prefoldin subunit 1 [Kluyveromyces marxianus]|uniref:Prefoldin subunit 1 n=1 Tax=Kluyveromyces marxianus TaxID=4911 RepID=A0ABX6EPJ6_KLUMA|nr:prefoldin subunit 1 [Kluyveromyces marxianus]